MVVGMRQTSSAASTGTQTGAGVLAEADQRDHRDQEDDRHAGEQNIQRDLVGRLAALGALHQRDHAVEEGGAGIGGDADHQPVGRPPACRR